MWWGKLKSLNLKHVYLYLHKIKLLRELIGGESIESLKDHINNKTPNYVF